MRSARLLLAACGVIFLAGGAAAAAGAGAEGPMAMLKKTNDKITKLLDQKAAAGSAAEKQRDEKITKIIDAMLDFDSIAKSALGKNWGERTDAERKEFVTVFRKLIQKNYLKQIHDKADYVMAYDKETIDGEKAVVETTVTASSKSGEEAQTAVVYKLRKAKGKWAVTDIETDEVSLVQNYRSQFNKIITKDGFPALLEKMKKKVAEGSGETGI